MQFRHFNNKYFVRRDKIKLYKNFKHKGFTLVELLIIIVVIGILAGAFIYSSTEAVTTAKATAIINNLNILKRATMQWYSDNLEKIDSTGKVRAKVDNLSTSQEYNPIQEYGDGYIGLSKYIDGTDIKLNTVGVKEGKNGKMTLAVYKNLAPGTYGVNAAPPDSSGSHKSIRLDWFVGYHFAENERNVMKKVSGRAATLGLRFVRDEGWPESKAYPDGDYVWLHVFGEGEYD